MQPPLKFRVLSALRDGPWVFLGVVLGVAVLFRVALSAAQTPPLEASAPAETATATATVTSTASATAAPGGPTRFEPDPAVRPLGPSGPAPRVRKPRRPR